MNSKLLKAFLSIILCFLLGDVFAQWKPDVLGEGFEQLTIHMPDDYEGAVNCVLVKSLPETQAQKAVLYVHGFNDYFFQKEQAQKFNEQGYAFYAVDLRKYGRAYLDHQKRGNVRKLSEYYPDLDTCLNIINETGYSSIILLGHSTGGLIVSVYADERQNSIPVKGMILNSPFLDMNFGKTKEKIGVPIVSGLGAIVPGIKINPGSDALYAKSVHKDFSGEWEYNLEWKPAESIPVSFGWTRAIHKGHKKVRKGLDIPYPVLVMHSDKSVHDDEYSEAFTKSDAILDVNDIHKYAQYLGKDVTIEVIHDGMHDLVLSRKDVREKVYETIFSWLKTLN